MDKLSERADCYTFPLILATHRNRKGSISSVNKFSLIRYHRDVFEKLYGFNRIKSSFYAFRNVFYYLIRKLFYIKRMKEDAKV